MTYLRGGKATENFQILYETMPPKFQSTVGTKLAIQEQNYNTMICIPSGSKKALQLSKYSTTLLSSLV